MSTLLYQFLMSHGMPNDSATYWATELAVKP